MSDSSRSGCSVGLPRRTTTLRVKWTIVGAGGAGGPTFTGSVRLGKLHQHRPVAVDVQRHGLGWPALAFALAWPRIDLGLDLDLPRRGLLGLRRARQEPCLADVVEDDVDVLVELCMLGALEARGPSSGDRLRLGAKLDQHAVPVIRVSRSTMSTSESLRICSLSSS